MTRQLTKWEDQKRDTKCPFCGECNETDEDTYMDGFNLEIQCWNCAQEFGAVIEVQIHVHDGYAPPERIAEWKAEQAGENDGVNNEHN